MSQWGYGTILGDRDINEHDIMRLYVFERQKFYAGAKQLSPEEVVTIVTDKMVPYHRTTGSCSISVPTICIPSILQKLVAWAPLL